MGELESPNFVRVVPQDVRGDGRESRRVAFAVGEEGDEDVSGMERAHSLLMGLCLVEKGLKTPLRDHEGRGDIL